MENLLLLKQVPSSILGEAITWFGEGKFFKLKQASYSILGGKKYSEFGEEKFLKLKQVPSSMLWEEKTWFGEGKFLK